MNKEEIKQEPNDGLIARILGGTPTILQKVFFILMAFSLILWPLGCYVSIFFFDVPVRSYVDKICRYGMLITIYLYPIYLFPLLRFMFQLSKNLRDTLYRYTYCLQNDSLYLNDINGRQYVNKINKVDDETIMFEGIADVKGIQIYHK